MAGLELPGAPGGTPAAGSRTALGVDHAPPDVRDSLPWRDLGDALHEADEDARPILCLLEPPWSNGAQRLALVLRDDDEARATIASSFVPLLIDPTDHPDVAARLRWAAATQGGTVGPPLMLVLTHEGDPFVSYCSLWPEGRDTYPSLRSLLHAVAELYRDRRREVVEEARALARRARGGSGSAPRYTAWQGVHDLVDRRFGGIDELPKAPRPELLWRLLAEAEHPPVAEHLRRTLVAMERGGIRDQLDGSFHRCARDERWVVPHFEKLVPANAALAAVYARAARVLEEPRFARVAEGAAAFALRGLAHDVMVVGADARYATWTPRELQEALQDPALVQAVALHVRMSRDDVRHVLYQALQPEEMLDYADEDVATMAARLAAGLDRLALARAARPSPATLDVPAPAWRAETLRWLSLAARSGADIDRARIDDELERLLSRPFEPGRGYARDHGPERGPRWWLEDQVALLGAALACADTLPLAREAAVELGELICNDYQEPETGALTDRPRAPGVPPSLDLVDGCLCACVPQAIALLGSFEAAVDRPRVAARFARAARAAEAFHRDPLHAASEALERSAPRPTGSSVRPTPPTGSLSRAAPRRAPVARRTPPSGSRPQDP